MKNIYKFIFLVIILFFLTEIFAYLFLSKDFRAQKSTNKTLGRLDSHSKFIQDHFCDSVHQTKRGEELMGQYIFKNILSLFPDRLQSDQYIWALGASTTSGFNCNSHTSWPLEFNKYKNGQKILNFSVGGANSTDSLKILNDNFRQQTKKPNLIIWAHGFSEIAFYGNKHDPQWKRVKEKYSQISQGTPYHENFIAYILRIDITLKKYSLGYFWFRSLFEHLIKSNRHGYARFLAILATSPSAEDKQKWAKDISYKREEYVFSGGFLGGPVRRLFSNQSQAIAAELYIENMKVLKSISLKHNFSVVCLSLPYISGGFSHFSTVFGSQVDKWINKIKQVNNQTCKNLNFKIIDIKSYYSEIDY